jgi:hypothetical protein
VIVSATSPYRETREQVRRRIIDFVGAYVDAPIEDCAERDVKGLYEKAFAGEIENFTGVSDPYEPPMDPSSSRPPKRNRWIALSRCWRNPRFSATRNLLPKSKSSLGSSTDKTRTHQMIGTQRLAAGLGISRQRSANYSRGPCKTEGST